MKANDWYASLPWASLGLWLVRFGFLDARAPPNAIAGRPTDPSSTPRFRNKTSSSHPPSLTRHHRLLYSSPSPFTLYPHHHQSRSVNKLRHSCVASRPPRHISGGKTVHAFLFRCGLQLAEERGVERNSWPPPTKSASPERSFLFFYFLSFPNTAPRSTSSHSSCHYPFFHHGKEGSRMGPCHVPRGGLVF